MKHYYHPNSRAMTTHWMLTELEAEHEQIVVDFFAGENATPEYRAINPMGKIPALVDGDIIVTETAAICAYLADKFADKGMCPSLSSNQRGRYYRYLFFPGTTLEPMLTLNQLEGNVVKPQSAGWGDLERCLATVEVMTPEQDWVLGPQFTAADVVYGGTLDSAVQFGLVESPSTKVAEYIGRLKKRDAYRSSHDPSWY